MKTYHTSLLGLRKSKLLSAGNTEVHALLRKVILNNIYESNSKCKINSEDNLEYLIQIKSTTNPN